MTEACPGFTRKLARFVAGTDADGIPGWAFEHAKVAFMDWVAVALAGKDDHLVAKLISMTGMLGGKKQATLIGHGAKRNVLDAALVNGSASHALDYDDTLVSFLGHPSVTIFPSLLALSEWKGKNGSDFLTAYIIGLQAGGTIGACAGLDHYMAGWHATSTLGHLASAAACSRLLGLQERQTIHALGIAATQSSGLKRVFGTMCKPFHAGRSSQAGLMAALMAGMGFTSAEDILEGPQGFFQAMGGAVNEDIVSMIGLGWDVKNLSQKYHASCHATHSPMEAAMMIVEGHGVPLDDIARITVHSSQLAIDAAGKLRPVSGAEGRFSIPYCVANALATRLTGVQAFTDEKVRDTGTGRLMEKIAVVNDPDMKALESLVEIETRDGKKYEAFSDILQQIPPLEVKKERIRSKFFDLCTPVIGDEKARGLAAAVADLEGVDRMGELVRDFLA